MRKRLFSTIMSCTLLISLFVTSAYAVYDDGPENTEYNRTNAQTYIGNYTTNPNDDYYYFDISLGGDCTNFASQVVHAGGMDMTPAKNNPGDDSWYYYNSTWGRGRSSSWTGATKFRTYWADINGVGEKNAYQFRAYTVSELNDDNTWYDVWSYLEPGDIVQHVSSSDWDTYHSQAVHRTSYENGEYKVSVGQHTSDGWRNLRDYVLSQSDNDMVCLIKISSNTYRARNISTLTVMSTDELAAEKERLNQTKPETMESCK